MPANYYAMDDATLVKLAATQVMGWKFKHERNGFLTFQPKNQSAQLYWDGCKGAADRAFNPLASDTDAFALVDAMKAAGFYFDLYDSLVRSTAEFHCPKGPCPAHGHTANDRGHGAEATTKDRRRGIVLAALGATDPEAQG